MTIEYNYSARIGKFTIRTTDIELRGKGISQQHSKKDGMPFNVYTLTENAFHKVCSQYPEMKLYN